MTIPGGPELLIILFIVLLLFGARKLPDLAGSMGKSIKEFRKASKGALDDDPEDTPSSSPAPSERDAES
jgi:sec-independent protein translocase protein TatA